MHENVLKLINLSSRNTGNIVYRIEKFVLSIAGNRQQCLLTVVQDVLVKIIRAKYSSTVKEGTNYTL